MKGDDRWLPAAIILALIGAMFFALSADLHRPVPSSGYPNREHQTHPADEHRDRQATEGNPSKAAPLKAQQPSDHHPFAAKADEKSEGHSSAEWWVAFWTAALFLSTTGLWGFTALLWWTTRRAVIEGQDAIAAAKANAESASRQATIMEQTAERQLRAYVYVFDVIISDVDAELPPTASVIVKNAGQTPAYNLTWRGVFSVQKFPLWEEIVLDRGTVAPTSVFPPGGTLSST